MIDFTIGRKYANIVVTESADITKVHSNALQNFCQRAWNSTALPWNSSFGFILSAKPSLIMVYHLSEQLVDEQNEQIITNQPLSTIFIKINLP